MTKKKKYCKTDESVVKRVKAMDEAFNSALEAMSTLEKDLDTIWHIRDTIAVLEDYQTSGLWKRDFEADESGALPPDCPRGVLSEDGLYDLLRDYDELMARMKDLHL